MVREGVWWGKGRGEGRGVVVGGVQSTSCACRGERTASKSE